MSWWPKQRKEWTCSYGGEHNVHDGQDIDVDCYDDDNDDDDVDNDDDDDGEKAMGRRVVRRGVDPKGLLPSANAQRPDLFDALHGDDDDEDKDGERC